MKYITLSLCAMLMFLPACQDSSNEDAEKMIETSASTGGQNVDIEIGDDDSVSMSADTEQVDFLHKIRTRTGSLKAGRFFLHFLELQISMGLGAFVCYLVVRLISSSPSYTTIYRPGTLLFALGDIFFLVIPVVAWMTVRGHGWRYSLEIAVAMIVPVAAIIVLGQLSRYAYLLWLITAGYPAMTLGMLVYMLYRHDHFLGWESRA